MTRIAVVFSIFTALLAAQPQPNEPARGRLARAIKIIPVPQLVGALPTPSPLPFGTMIDCAPFSERHEQHPFSEPDASGPGRVGDLVALVKEITPLSWSDGNVNVDLVGDALLVTGAPDQIHLIEQSLQKLTTCLGEPFRIRAAAFSAEAALDLPAVANSFTEARAKLLELGAKFAWEQTTTASPGQRVQLGSLTTSAYVGDIEVEIAQSSTMANPVVRPIYVGAAVQVLVHALVGNSDAVILAQYASGESIGPLLEVGLGKDESMLKLQVPSVAIDTGTLSGRIRNGGALVLVADGKWGGRSFGLILSAERTPVPPEAERDLGLFQLGAFLAHALRWQFEVPPVGEGNVELWTPPLVTGAVAPPLDPADQQTWSTLFARALGDEQTSVGIDRHLALVSGSGAANARPTVARLIELLQDQFFKTVEVECRLNAQDERPGAAVQRLRFPALLGRSHGLVHGIESTGIIDVDVEVAQKSGISDPKVARHFSGVDCQVIAYGLVGAELGMSASVRLTDTVAARVYMPDNRRGVPIDQPKITRGHLTHAGKVPSEGKPIEFGDGPSVLMGDRVVHTRPSLSLRLR